MDLQPMGVSKLKLKHPLQRPSRRNAQVRPETEELVLLVVQDKPLEQIDTWLFQILAARSDAELELLASHILTMSLEQDVPEARAAVSRGHLEEAFALLGSRMRRRVAKLLRDHQRSEDDAFLDMCSVD